VNGTSRRRFLQTSAAATLAALAGCFTVTESSETSTPPTEEGGQSMAPTDEPTGTGPATGAETTPETSTDDPETPTDDPETPTTPSGSDAVVWFASAGSSVSADPVVGDSTVYAGSEDGAVHAYDGATGELAWTFDAGEAIQNMARSDGTLLTVSGTTELFADQTLDALDAASGARRWTASPREWWLDLVVAADGTAYVATADDVIEPGGETLYAYSLSDGRMEWSADTGDTREGVLTDDAVVVSTYERTYASDRTSGETLWQREVPDETLTTLGAVGDTVVYAYEDPAASVYSVLVGVDAATGEDRWRFEAFGVTSTAVRDGVVYAGGGGVAALDPADGSTLWTDDSGGFLTDESATADRVYAGGESIRALDRQSGELEWTWTPDPPQSGVSVAGTTGEAVLVDAFHEADPRNQYKFAVDPADGSQRWAFEDGTDLTDLAVGGAGAATGGENGLLYALA